MAPITPKRKPVKKAAGLKGAVKPKPRAKSRVDSSEPSGKTATKSAQHRQVKTPVQASAQDLGSGEVLISAQLSELVPVAQYASVTLGPDQLCFKISADMSVLADADWDGDLTAEQQEVYDLVRGSLTAGSKILEHHIAEDRETVERSVREHNERESTEQASAAKKSRGRGGR